MSFQLKLLIIFHQINRPCSKNDAVGQLDYKMPLPKKTNNCIILLIFSRIFGDLGRASAQLAFKETEVKRNRTRDKEKDKGEKLKRSELKVIILS